MKMVNLDDIQIIKIQLSEINYLKELETEQNIDILSKKSIERDIQNTSAYYFGAKIDDEIIGYIGVSYVFDFMDILSIVVKKDYQNNGIGTTLLNYIINFAKEKNISKIFLEVRASNVTAQKLYDKFNFKKINIRKRYYPDNFEDAFIYMKDIIM